MRQALALLFVLNFLLVSAQNDSTQTQGEIVAGEVVIEKDKQIILPKADKIFTRSALRSFSNDSIRLQFQPVEPSLVWPAYSTDVPPVMVAEPYPTEPFQNYVKLGYGNFNAPLFEAGIFQNIGAFETHAKLYYESFETGPVNKENSGSSVGGIILSAQYKAGAVSFRPELNYRRRGYRFYGNSNRVNEGFKSEADEVGEDNVDFSVQIARTNEELNYVLKPFISSISQQVESNSHNRETVLGLNGMMDFKINETFKTGLTVKGNTANYDGGISYRRSLLNVNPWLKVGGEEYTLKAGFNVSSGMVDQSSKTGFYPDLHGEYFLTDKWTVHAFVTGGIQWNGLNMLLDQNAFLDDSLFIAHQDNRFQIGGGVTGHPIKNMELTIELSNSTVEGLPIFTPSAADSSRYVLSYDTENINILSLKSSLSFIPTATSTYGASLTLNNYSTESLDRAWHLPNVEFIAFTSHNIEEKLILSAYVTSLGGLRGPANVDFGYVNLPVFIDLGLGAKYLISQRASLFVDVNNLLNDEYERYLGYPTRGLAFKIGGQYRF